MAEIGQNRHALAKLTVSFTDRERARLERVANARGTNLSRLLAEAVIHLAATIELGQQIHYLVPSEQAEQDKPEKK